MSLSNEIFESITELANDGARPHIKTGIVKRLQAVCTDMLLDESVSGRYVMRLIDEIAALKQMP